LIDGLRDALRDKDPVPGIIGNFGDEHTVAGCCDSNSDRPPPTLRPCCLRPQTDVRALLFSKKLCHTATHVRHWLSVCVWTGTPGPREIIRMEPLEFQQQPISGLLRLGSSCAYLILGGTAGPWTREQRGRASMKA
jgi:hypothetical protein